MSQHYTTQVKQVVIENLAQDPSEFNIKYWTEQMAKWDEEQKAFETDLVTTEVVESSTYYDPEEVAELA